MLKTALSLAVVGTLLTAAIGALAAVWLFDLGTLEALIVGSAIAATDSAAIFAVLRGSTLRRRLARALEGESGLNDPIAVLLVTGFIAWIDEPGYGLENMLVEFAGELLVGAVVGGLVGWGARWAFTRLDYPTPGLYPVASMAAAALSFGLADVGHGSGFLAVYLTGLALGTGIVPARLTVTAFHQGLSWVAQISLFFMLGLLVFPSELADVAFEGTALALVLIFVARPIATIVATQVDPFRFRERVMLSWAGLRGAVPIWLATLPVIAGVDGSEPALQRRLLRRRDLDPDPGIHVRAAGAAARTDDRRGRASPALRRDRDDPGARRRRPRDPGRARRRRGRPHDQGARAARDKR